MQRAILILTRDIVVGTLATVVGFVLLMTGLIGTFRSLVFYIFSFQVGLSPAILGATTVTLLFHPWLFLLGFYLCHRGLKMFAGNGWWRAGKYGPMYLPDLRFALGSFLLYVVLVLVRLLLN